MYLKSSVTAFLCFSLFLLAPSLLCANTSSDELQSVLDAWMAASKPTNASCSSTGMAADMANMNIIGFISTGIPEPALTDLLRQASERPDVLLVLRGWKPPHLVQTFRRLYKLMEPGKPANIIIHPMYFRQYGIEAVPVFLVKNASDGRWYRVTGEISIEGAEQAVREGRAGRNAPPVGPLYDISEPDILALIEKRIQDVDWEALVQGAKDRLHDKLRQQFVDLPRATETTRLFHDPSIRIMRDITTPDGHTLAKAGSILNPLNYVSLPSRYIVYDPEDPKQVPIVAQWLEDDPSATLLAIRNWPLANQQFPSTRAYPCLPRIAERLGVTAVPAFIRQNKKALEVSYVAIR